jgi:hypothetical protein
LLETDPHLHRVDGLTVSAGESAGQVRVRFRYTTLVMDPAPEVEAVNLQPKFALDSPQRRVFDGIVQRDILRPYIKRVAVPNPGSPGGTPPATSPGVRRGRKVSRLSPLSEWLGQPEVHVRDMINQRTMRFKPGDALAGGTIVMVDYPNDAEAGNELLQAFQQSDRAHWRGILGD